MGFISYINGKMCELREYTYSHQHTVLGKTLKVILNNGVSVGVGTDRGNPSANIKIGDNPIATYTHNPDTIIIEPKTDNEYTVKNAMKDVAGCSEMKTEFEISPEELTQRIVDIVFDLSKGDRVEAIIKVADVVGVLQRELTSENAKRYFYDAEIAIQRYIDEHNINEVPFTESDLRDKAEMEINFAKDRLLESIDPYPT